MKFSAVELSKNFHRNQYFEKMEDTAAVCLSRLILLSY